MPLIVDRRDEPTLGWGSHCGGLRVALINNMPDLVFGETESQFVDLLNVASRDTPVHLSRFSLPGVPRHPLVKLQMDQTYCGLDELWNQRFDAVIVTGTEPRRHDLRMEPYWSSLAQVMDWAQENTVSAILSCLAAHAGVLHTDGISRGQLPTKQCGIFDFQCTMEHALTCHLPSVVSFPHSRWNEVSSHALTEGGYTVLSESAHAGVDLFVKRKKECLFVHFQGHPEYGKATLLDEYRRDVKRFLKGLQGDYPSLPYGYFNAHSVEVLSAFRKTAVENRSEELMNQFPTDLVSFNLRRSWKSAAECIYNNWLQYVVSRKLAASVTGVMPKVSASSEVVSPL